MKFVINDKEELEPAIRMTKEYVKRFWFKGKEDNFKTLEPIFDDALVMLIQRLDIEIEEN